jgi:hypothetical protein
MDGNVRMRKSTCILWLLFAVLLSSLTPRSAYAANNCPWLNEATASGILGGSSVGVFKPEAKGQAAVCEFTFKGSDAQRTLRIIVETSVATPHARLTAVEHTCAVSSSPLDAIGNEAIVCLARPRGRERSEFVAGRVRDQVFSITLTTDRRDDPSFTAETMRMHIAVAAEQVSGNLF